MSPKQYTINFEEWGEEQIPHNHHVSSYTEDMRQVALRAQFDHPEVYGSGDIFFISFGSGSSGNCSYIGSRQGGVIVDAGVNPDMVEPVLKTNGIDMSKVCGICLTHDHSDHVRYAYTLLRRNKHMRLYCTNRVLNGILRRHSISRRIKDYHQPIFKEIPFQLAGFDITSFDVPHDAADSAGFFFELQGRSMAIATDLGAITERARHYMSRANYLVIEANYDLNMLVRGPYPEYLKARIRTANGHLDNLDTAAFLSEIIRPELKYVFLCHLSQDNNTPDKAHSAIKTVLEQKGVVIGGGEETVADREADLQLVVLPRHSATRLYVFKGSK